MGRIKREFQCWTDAKTLLVVCKTDSDDPRLFEPLRVDFGTGEFYDIPPANFVDFASIVCAYLTQQKTRLAKKGTWRSSESCCFPTPWTA